MTSTIFAYFINWQYFDKSSWRSLIVHNLASVNLAPTTTLGALCHPPSEWGLDTNFAQFRDLNRALESPSVGHCLGTVAESPNMGDYNPAGC